MTIGRPSASQRPAQRRHRWIQARRAASGFAPFGAFVLGFVLVAGVVVRGRLVDPQLYLAALDDTNAYERAYTQVLADPEFADLTESLIGELGVTQETSRRLRVVSTSALRWTVPPSRLEMGVEAFVVDLLEYARGETSILEADVEIADIAARVLETVLAELGVLLAEAAQSVATSVVEYEGAIAEFADQLAAGRVPASVPIWGGTTFDPNQAVEVILAEVGGRADERLARQVRASVLVGGQREALVAAASALVADHAQRISEGLREDPLGTRYLDVLNQLAERSGLEEQELVADLNTIRRVQGWLRPPTAVLGAALMVGASAVLLRRYRADPRRAARSLALCGIASGVVVGAAWLGAVAVIDSPLDPAGTAGEAGWQLPTGLRLVLVDVQASLAGGLEDVVRRLIVVPVVVGGVLAAASWLPQVAGVGAKGLAVGFGATVAAVVGLAWYATPGPGIATERACNGHADLCGRRYDEVVYATTHNAMSSPDVVHFWPEQDHDLRQQLDSGVRALMLDTYYWTPLESGTQLAVAGLPQSLADQLVGLVGERRREGRGGVYLCHSHCSLGAKPLGDGLRQVRSFLDDNPDEVVTLIIQDAISRADTADAFARAELDPYLHEQPADAEWPTLGELIGRGTRLVVFAQSAGPPPGWYHDAFEHIQETPYLFRSPEELSCVRNRGRRGARLFLMNHWVQRIAPDRAVAAVVNRRAAIVERARTCEQERGQLPNFVAVNFSNIGDVMGAVDDLNSVGSAPSPR